MNSIVLEQCQSSHLLILFGLLSQSRCIIFLTNHYYNINFNKSATTTEADVSTDTDMCSVTTGIISTKETT